MCLEADLQKRRIITTGEISLCKTHKSWSWLKGRGSQPVTLDSPISLVSWRGQQESKSTSSSHGKVQLSQSLQTLQTTAEKHLRAPPTHCVPPCLEPHLACDFLPQKMKILPFLPVHPPSAEELRLQECIDTGLYVKAV